ncbi:MAG: hypothetical protein WBA74_10825, partial [Cyclobacteriaceae bacterium]
MKKDNPTNISDTGKDVCPSFELIKNYASIKEYFDTIENHIQSCGKCKLEYEKLCRIRDNPISQKDAYGTYFEKEEQLLSLLNQKGYHNHFALKTGLTPDKSKEILSDLIEEKLDDQVNEASLLDEKITRSYFSWSNLAAVISTILIVAAGYLIFNNYYDNIPIGGLKLDGSEMPSSIVKHIENQDDSDDSNFGYLFNLDNKEKDFLLEAIAKNDILFDKQGTSILGEYDEASLM